MPVPDACDFKHPITPERKRHFYFPVGLVIAGRLVDAVPARTNISGILRTTDEDVYSREITSARCIDVTTSLQDARLRGRFRFPVRTNGASRSFRIRQARAENTSPFESSCTVCRTLCRGSSRFYQRRALSCTGTSFRVVFWLLERPLLRAHLISTGMSNLLPNKFVHKIEIHRP